MIDFAAAAESINDERGIAVSGQPTEQNLDSIADAGYTAVIDLRGTNESRGYEEKTAVEDRGMEYVSLPIAGASDISLESASELDAVLSRIDGPVLVHCGSGNRVGALLALREQLHGASTAEALALGDRAGLTSLRPLVEKTLNDIEAGKKPGDEAR